MAVLAIGMSLFFVGAQPLSATAPDPATGNLFAAASGLTYGLLIMGLRGSAGTAVRWGVPPPQCVAEISSHSPQPSLWLSPVTSATLTDWTAIAFLGVFQIGVAYAFLVHGIARVPALEASLLLIAEPVLSPFWAWLIHGEMPSVWAIFGGIVILGITTVMALTNERKD